MTMFLHHFFSPSGRIGRKTWWLSRIALEPAVYVAFGASILLASALVDLVGSEHPAVAVSSAVALLAAPVWSMFAINTKRLHDLGFSAWWNILAFIPVLGCLMLGCMAGDDTANRYGD